MKAFVCGLLLGFAAALPRMAALSLDTIYGSGMVLQREIALPVRGSGDPGKTVVVRLSGEEKTAIVMEDGRWKVCIDPLSAGGPHVLSVRCDREEVRLTDIWVGDVWLASGQSNMVMMLKAASGGHEAAMAPYRGILRIWQVDRKTADEPQESLSAGWRPGEGETALDFSAVGFYFGRMLAENTGVPIGVVNASWGGTPIESWTRGEILSGHPDFVPILRRWRQTLENYPAAKKLWDSVSPEERHRAYLQRAEDARSKGLPKVYPEWPPPGPGSPNAPSSLWNGMIHPLTKLPIRGVIWYQGESNAAYAEQYAKLFPAMIHDWRAHWRIGSFPFYFVQLANFNAFRKQETEPVESSWAELREAQAETRALVANTGMAVAIDVGEADEIHPRDKQAVGRRLALLALKHTYGQEVVCEGPRYRGFSVTPTGNVELEFSRVAKGLTLSDGAKQVRGVAVAAADRRFVWAEAEIISPTTVLVRKPAGLGRIVAVRYNWGDTPDGKLCNSADLPAEPFRTDDWPGVTAGKR